METRIYKIISRDDWERTLAKGLAYRGNDGADARDGFIHLSTFEQVHGVLSRWFRDADLDQYLLVEADTEKIGDTLRWEPGANVEGDLFPHIYGELSADVLVRYGKFRGWPASTSDMRIDWHAYSNDEGSRHTQ